MNGRFVASLLLVALAAVWCSGCGDDPAGDASSAGVTISSRGGDTDGPAGEKEISLTTVDVAGYEQALADQKGKVVLVDFWATWCPPCVARFPETVEWSKTYADQGLAVISVSFDDADAEESALEFLKEQKAQFANLRSQWGAGQETVDNFKIQGGGVPYYRLYDREGELRFEFSGNPEGLDKVEGLEQMEARLKELLAEPAA